MTSVNIDEHRCDAIKTKMNQAEVTVATFRHPDVSIFKMDYGIWWLEIVGDWDESTPINFCPFCGEKLT